MSVCLSPVTTRNTSTHPTNQPDTYRHIDDAVALPGVVKMCLSEAMLPMWPGSKSQDIEENVNNLNGQETNNISYAFAGNTWHSSIFNIRA